MIDRLARQGNDRAVSVSRAQDDARRPQPSGADGSAGLLPPELGRRVDFSFSGLKTAVMRLVAERRGSARTVETAAAPAFAT